MPNENTLITYVNAKTQTKLHIHAVCSGASLFSLDDQNIVNANMTEYDQTARMCRLGDMDIRIKMIFSNIFKMKRLLG